MSTMDLRVNSVQYVPSCDTNCGLLLFWECLYIYMVGDKGCRDTPGTDTPFIESPLPNTTNKFESFGASPKLHE